MIEIAQEFYITGGTVGQGSACYVRRQADWELLEHLLAGRFCYVLTSRQMGKSSLMVYTASQLVSGGIQVVILDITAIGQNLTVEQWYAGLLDQIGPQLDLTEELDEFWEQHFSVGPLQRWMKAIREVVLEQCRQQVVVFVDEVDAVGSLPFSTDEWFAGMREFYNRRNLDPELNRLTFCLLGVASPSDLIRDPRTTPFNIGQRIELDDFSDSEAKLLMAGLGRHQSQAQVLFDRIMYWTGGHPYLTQRLCQAVAEEIQKPGLDGVDRVCRSLFLSDQARDRDDNLIFVRERLLKSEPDPTQTLELYRRVCQGRLVTDDKTDPVVEILRLAGVVRGHQGRLKLRNRIYAHVFDLHWVRAKMLPAEVQRQRAAFRRGILRTSALALIVIAVIGGLAYESLRQRDRALGLQERAERQEQVIRQQLYAAQMNLAGHAWDVANIKHVENLLEHQVPKPGEADLRGWEWYYLRNTCRQAITTLRGHTRDINSVCFSKDGRRLLTAGQDRTLRIWNWETSRELQTIYGHDHRVERAFFSPDQTKIISCGIDRTVRIWDATSGTELKRFTQPAGVFFDVAGSPDGTIVVGANENGVVYAWETGRWTELAPFKGHTQAVQAVVFSPDGRRMASGGNDRSVNIWDVKTRRIQFSLTGHTDLIESAAYSPDGTLLATTGGDRTVRFWDPLRGREVFKIDGLKDTGETITFSPDGKLVAVGMADNTVLLWDVIHRKQLNLMKGHWESVRTVAFAPAGSRMATAGRDFTVKVWNTPSQPEWLELEGGGRYGNGCFSPDGNLVAKGGDDGVVRLWEQPTGRQIARFPSHLKPIRDVAFSPDGTILASCGEDNQVKLRILKTGQEVGVLQGHTGLVRSLTFSPNGDRLVSVGFDNLVKLWDVKAMKEITTLKGHQKWLNQAAFSPDGRILATVDDDWKTKIWEAATGVELATLHQHTDEVWRVAFSPDGKKLATGSRNKEIIIWEVGSWKKLASLQGHTGFIVALAWSPDGTRLASGSWDLTVKIWDIPNGVELLTLVGYHREPNVLAFSNDGMTLMTSSADNLVKLFRADGLPWIHHPR